MYQDRIQMVDRSKFSGLMVSDGLPDSPEDKKIILYVHSSLNDYGTAVNDLSFLHYLAIRSQLKVFAINFQNETLEERVEEIKAAYKWLSKTNGEVLLGGCNGGCYTLLVFMSKLRKRFFKKYKLNVFMIEPLIDPFTISCANDYGPYPALRNGGAARIEEYLSKDNNVIEWKHIWKRLENLLLIYDDASLLANQIESFEKKSIQRNVKTTSVVCSRNGNLLPIHTDAKDGVVDAIANFIFED